MTSNQLQQNKNDNYLRSGKGDEVDRMDFTTWATKSSFGSVKVLRVRRDKQH